MVPERSAGRAALTYVRGESTMRDRAGEGARAAPGVDESVYLDALRPAISG